MKNFVGELEMSPIASVDAFLESRPEFILVGKHAIAYELVRREKPANFLDSGSDDSENWYRWLFNLMLSKRLDGFHENRLSVVTFNYDRSFEFFFLNGLKYTFGLSFEEAEQRMASIPVVHVHGQLGQLIEDGQAEDARAYTPEPRSDFVITAANGIRIVHEVKDDNDEQMAGFRKAWKLIKSAETILFLGFGYDPLNLSRLLRHASSDGVNAFVSGTTKGLTEDAIASQVYPEFRKYGLKFAKLPEQNKSTLPFLAANVGRLVGSGRNFD